MATTTKEKTSEEVLASNDPEVLKARIRELEARPAAPEILKRKGWRILTPIANFEGTMKVAGSKRVSPTNDEMLEVRFIKGEAFVEDRVAARHLCSDFGYFSDPAFEDIAVHPTYIDPVSREVRQWFNPDGQLPTTSGIPDGYERRYMVRDVRQ